MALLPLTKPIKAKKTVSRRLTIVDTGSAFFPQLAQSLLSGNSTALHDIMCRFLCSCEAAAHPCGYSEQPLSGYRPGLSPVDRNSGASWKWYGICHRAHGGHHTDNDDEAESQMKRIPDDYFNGHRHPVLVNKKTTRNNDINIIRCLDLNLDLIH
jgi:hypothetical protein